MCQNNKIKYIIIIRNRIYKIKQQYINNIKQFKSKIAMIIVLKLLKKVRIKKAINY